MRNNKEHPVPLPPGAGSRAGEALAGRGAEARRRPGRLCRRFSDAGLKALCAALLALCLAGCTIEDGRRPTDDLSEANRALKERDIGDAEMYFKRYLRKNAHGVRRWEVWNSLLNIALTVRQDKTTAAEYLEIMRVEFEQDPPRRRSIQQQLAALYNDTHAYARAVALWEAMAGDPDTPADDLARVYQDLSRAYMRRLEFTAAKEALNLCLQLPVDSATKADCLYVLAETEMLTEELEESEKVLQGLVDMPDIPESRRVQAIFMLADVLEQRDRLDDAEDLLESIRDSYPNARVVALRLAALKDKKKARRDARPVRK